MRNEDVIAGVARHDVGADAGLGENSADCGCQAYGIEGGMDLQGDPGCDEVVGQIQLVGLLLREDEGQSLGLPNQDDGIGASGKARLSASDQAGSVTPPLSDLVP